ncbi:MAG: glycosyltransferase [Alloprevotella sp.]|nr:glycosyltransferase [Alloprevotella sp.]
MNILINASNLKVGGGLQVADSVFRELPKYKEHRFIIVYSDALLKSAEEAGRNDNIIPVRYNMPSDWRSLLFGRNLFLDELVSKEHIYTVITIFGPSRWRPRVRHLLGFARAQLLLPESPYWTKQEVKKNWKLKLKLKLLKRQFDKDSEEYYTESPFISERLMNLYSNKRVYTISNTCNQVFSSPQLWDKNLVLPQFSGFRLLTIAANYPHKNLEIIPAVIDVLKLSYPDFKFQFVLSIDKDESWSNKVYSERYDKHILFIGKVSVSQCPFLYKQCDAMFLPTLLECFSANYVEAMKMRKPILTSDLGFARGICGEAAVYFNPISAKDIAEKIYLLASNSKFQENLVEKGGQQEKIFDTPEQRVKKMIDILSYSGRQI